MKKQETTPKTREELFAEKTDKCPLYRDDQPVRMPLSIAKIYYDMPQRIAHPLKQHLIDHFNRKRYYEMIRKSVADGVVEAASSIASKIKLSPRTIQRELTRLKDLNVIKHEGPDNGGHWIILKDLKL